MRIPEKARQDTLCRKCVLQPVGSAGHVQHSGVSGVRNVDVLLFRLEWALWGFQKIAPGLITSFLYFCIRWDLHVT
jgi:hypothetical protein